MTREVVYKQTRENKKKKEIKTLHGIYIAENIRHSGLGKWSMITLAPLK